MKFLFLLLLPHSSSFSTPTPTPTTPSSTKILKASLHYLKTKKMILKPKPRRKVSHRLEPFIPPGTPLTPTSPNNNTHSVQFAIDSFHAKDVYDDETSKIVYRPSFQHSFAISNSGTSNSGTSNSNSNRIFRGDFVKVSEAKIRQFNNTDWKNSWYEKRWGGFRLKFKQELSDLKLANGILRKLTPEVEGLLKNFTEEQLVEALEMYENRPITTGSKSISKIPLLLERSKRVRTRRRRRFMNSEIDTSPVAKSTNSIAHSALNRIELDLIRGYPPYPSDVRTAMEPVRLRNRKFILQRVLFSVFGKWGYQDEQRKFLTNFTCLELANLILKLSGCPEGDMCDE